VLDFDDCGFGWHLYDLAAALSFMEHRAEVPALVAAWLRGYRSIRELSTEDEAEIPSFLMLRRMLILAWMGTHPETQLAADLGRDYVQRSSDLGERYLARFG
jgi:Ser/Thr protein kinase RdoA (MazF antagonist)